MGAGPAPAAGHGTILSEPAWASARAAPRPATAPLAHAHWKLKPPIRPSTSSSSPQRWSPGAQPRLHGRQPHLVERHAARRRLGVLEAAVAHHWKLMLKKRLEHAAAVVAGESGFQLRGC